ncbi:hypothetical protein ACPM5D_005692, partial [Escherichia coli]
RNRKKILVELFPFFVSVRSRFPCIYPKLWALIRFDELLDTERFHIKQSAFLCDFSFNFLDQPFFWFGHGLPPVNWNAPQYPTLRRWWLLSFGFYTALL